MPFSNSYILKANVGPKFIEELNVALSRIKTKMALNWWGTNPYPIHLTVGCANGRKAGKATVETQEEIEARNRELAIATDAILSKYDKSMLLIPKCIRISENGFILLEFFPVLLAGEDPAALDKMHKSFVAQGKRLGLVFKDEYCNEGFAPHVSIGKVQSSTMGRIYPTPEEIKAAKDDLNKFNTLIANELEKIRILALFDFDLSYSPPTDFKFSKFREKLGDNHILVSKKIPARDYGVSKAELTTDGVRINFRDGITAKQCSEFLFQLGIYSSVKVGGVTVAKTVRPGNYLILTKGEYLKIAGMIHKCYPSVVELTPSIGVVDGAAARPRAFESKEKKEDLESKVAHELGRVLLFKGPTVPEDERKRDLEMEVIDRICSELSEQMFKEVEYYIYRESINYVKYKLYNALDGYVKGWYMGILMGLAADDGSDDDSEYESFRKFEYQLMEIVSRNRDNKLFRDKISDRFNSIQAIYRAEDEAERVEAARVETAQIKAEAERAEGERVAAAETTSELIKKLEGQKLKLEEQIKRLQMESGIASSATPSPIAQRYQEMCVNKT